jgi:hypothetical protein
MHGDGMLEFIDTTNDGPGGVVRRRDVEYFMPESVYPVMGKAYDNPSFDFYEPADGTTTARCVFDPTETQQEIKEILLVETPAGDEVGRLALEGDGELVSLMVDESGLLDVLTDLANGAFGENLGADEHEIQHIDNMVPDEHGVLVPEPNERSDFVQTILSRISQLLEDFRVPGEDGVLFTSDDGGWVWANEALGGKSIQYPMFSSVYAGDLPYTTLGLSGLLDNDANGGAFDLCRPKELRDISDAEAAFRLTETLNENTPSVIGVFVDRLFRDLNDDWRASRTPRLEPFDASSDNLTNELARVIVHELGHSVGLYHTSNDFDQDDPVRHVDIGLPGANEDIMGTGGYDPNGTLTTPVTGSTWKIALGLDFTAWDLLNSFSYFYAYRLAHLAHSTGPRYFGVSGDTEGDVNWREELATDAGELLVSGAFEPSYVKDLLFEPTLVDGNGENATTLELMLFNTGGQDLTIHEVRIEGGDGEFTIDAVPLNGRTLAPGESENVAVVFDPVTSGDKSARLVFYNDGSWQDYYLDLSGFGLSPDADLDVTFSSNNLGGAWIGDQPVQAEDVLKLTNVGSQPLSIYDVSLGGGAGVFGIGGLPVDTSFAHPLVLEPGESRQLDVLFLPTEAGLQRGLIHIFSDDPDQPIATATVVGTGLDGAGASWAGDYVAIQAPGNAPSHNRSDANGGFTRWLGTRHVVHLRCV